MCAIVCPRILVWGLFNICPHPGIWNGPFVVVSGTTDEGLRWAADALATGELDGRLDGNLTFVQEKFVESFDLIAPKQLPDLEAASTAIPDTIEAATVTPMPTLVAQVTLSPDSVPETTNLPPQTEAGNIPDKYQPPNATSPNTTNLIILLIGAGLLLLVGGAIFTWRKSRRNDAA